MIVKPPITLKEFKAVENSLVSMMANPYCDHSMYLNLEDKLADCRNRIKNL